MTTEPAIVSALIKTIREGLSAYEGRVFTAADARFAANNIAHSLSWAFTIQLAESDITLPLRP